MKGFKGLGLVPGEFSAQKNKEISDNYNLVMGRTWYGIAGSHPSQGKMDVFWEYNSWVSGAQSQRFTNHTVTRNKGESKLKDYGIWKGSINKDGLFTLHPTKIIMGMSIPLPVKLATRWLSFPENNSLEQVWTYYSNFFGKRLFIMFALIPHLSEEAYQSELTRLQNENEVDMGEYTFYRIDWSESYKPGDTGEDKINSFS